MCRFALILLAASLTFSSSVSFAAPGTAPGANEKALRERVAQFYDLLVAGKFRQSEALVLPDDRDRYYAAEKPVIKDYKIKSIEWGAGHKTVQISMVSKTVLRKARIGEFEVDYPYFSHWKLEKGQWWWYYPELSHRPTPFGDMPIQPSAGAGSVPNIQEMIAKGPKTVDVQHGVTADPNVVSLTNLVGFRAIIKLKNNLPGPIKLELGNVASKVFQAHFSNAELKGGEVADLIVERIGSGVPDQQTLTVTVTPTHQVLTFRVIR